MLKRQSHTKEVAKAFTVEIEVAITNGVCTESLAFTQDGGLRTAKAVWN